MSYSIITQPHIYTAGYSSIPLKVFDTQYETSRQYKYIINAVYDTVNVISATTISFNGSIYTQVICNEPHKYSLGDTLLLDDSTNNNLQTGYYNVLSVVSPTQLIIDLFPSIVFQSYPIRLSKFYKWKLNPDLDGYGKLDMSNVMKDLVSQDLTGQTIDYGLTYEGKNTMKSFGLLCGYETQYVFEFEDNIFISGGSLGFYNSTITNVNDVPFEVGDLIQIQQNPVAWGYSGITNDGSGFLRYSSSQNHSFLPNQQIQVQGQTTLVGYNGYTSVRSTPTPTLKTLSTNQTFNGNSTTPGFIYGIPRPQYNTTATITGLYVIPTYGLVVQTNLPFNGSTVPVSGQITFPGNQLKTTLNQYTNYSAFTIYNAHINRTEYSVNAFDPYVIQIRDVDKNNISTILNRSNCYRVEPSTIGFLLSHTPPSGKTFNTGMAYEFLNSNGTNLGITYLPKSDISQTDWYSPMGLEQISKSPYKNFSGVFSGYSGSVSSYNTYVYFSGSSFTRVSKKICFKLNQDCSKYEVYHLMWKDQYGSFISYPFIYVSRDYIESEKKTYYQQEGNWDNNTYGYKDYGTGEKVFYERSRESLTINSGWLYEFERDLIKDLIQSPSVFIQTPQNRLYSCHLDSPKVELYKEINESLFSYTFNVRLSNNENRF